MISVWHFAALVGLVAMSAFFSATEMAFSSANFIRLENVMESGNRRAGAACRILESYDKALSTLLIGNNLVNISASSLATVIGILIMGSDDYSIVSTTVVTILILVFGETMPKIVAKKNANRLAIALSYFVRFFMVIFKPFVAVVVWLTHAITDRMKGEANQDEQAAVEELQSIIETVEDEGVIDEERGELLQAALDFSDISVNEIMTARVDMETIDIEDEWDEIMRIVDETPYSRLPVYKDSIDNIVGILSLNHFLRALTDSDRVDIETLLMQPCYVYKTLKLPGVLAELKKKKMHLAVVTDDYGGTMGVVTMEDVLEQLVGEIWDETDTVVDEIVELENGVIEVDGDMNIYDFLEYMDISEKGFESDSLTVGGWTLEMFSAFPGEGESFVSNGLEITVKEMDGLRVEKVEVKRECP